MPLVQEQIEVLNTLSDSPLVLPTPQQVEWADCELGVIIHLDVQVFEPSYQFREQRGYCPSPSVFNPTQLDTDQWIETAARTGAKYAVLVAKHCSGFSLWPTQAHNYSVASSPWRDGQGDIVADFFASCQRYGLRPGLYCSAACNAYLNVDNPGRVLSDDAAEQQRYNDIVIQQLTELWTNYGDLFEVWFDGGVLPPQQGGPDIVGLLQKLQPNAVVYCGPAETPHLVRCSGNEHGYASLPNWSLTDSAMKVGKPEGDIWAPAECDIPSRKAAGAFQGGWFWRKGDERFLYNPDELVESYFRSIGQNSNLLLGMVIDDKGLVPEADVQVCTEFGEKLRRCFAQQVAKTGGAGSVLHLAIPEGQTPNILAIQEDIAWGERIRQFQVEALIGERWRKIWEGSCVGHKRIERFEPLRTTQLRLTVTESVAEPQILQFSAWKAEEGVFQVPLSLAQRSDLTIGRDENGLVCIRCSNPTLSIRITTDGTEPDNSSSLYEDPFPLPDGATVKAFSFINEECRSKTVSATFGCNRSSWQILEVSHDSSFDNGGIAGVGHLLNDDPTTYWHTYEIDKSKSAPPHEVIFDMGRLWEIEAFTFLPRDSETNEGTPDQYQFYLSKDGQTWTIAAQGQFDDLDTKRGLRLIPLKTTQEGRFLRFVALHVINDGEYIVIAGIGAVATKL
jgi:alpha-L-fucosidase